jgi:hypothetical protein
MITDDFNESVIANMEAALQQACALYPRQLAGYEARKRIAAKLIEHAERGERTLKGFTDVAVIAVADDADMRRRRTQSG